MTKKISIAITWLSIIIIGIALIVIWFWQTHGSFKLPTVYAGNYKNEKYGFEIDLPDSWRGYTVIEESWEGQTPISGVENFKGPKIIIRNPRWTEKQPWQDISIIIFTPTEWKLIENELLVISSAPIGPSKIGENNNYIFAIPPHWLGFTEYLGQDEAGEIIKSFRSF